MANLHMSTHIRHVSFMWICNCRTFRLLTHFSHISATCALLHIFPQKFALSTAITTTTSLKMMQHKARISSKYISLQCRRRTNDEKTNWATLYLLASSATEPQAVSTKHHIIIIASSICHADALVSTHTRTRKQTDRHKMGHFGDVSSGQSQSKEMHFNTK